MPPEAGKTKGQTQPHFAPLRRQERESNMEAIVKRAIERRLKQKGLSHKQAIIAVSAIAAVVADMKEAMKEIERATAHVQGDHFRFEVPRG